MSERENLSVGVPQAARLWSVQRQTAHKWFTDGTVRGALRIGHALRASDRAVREAKVLLASDLESKFGVPRARLGQAERDGDVQAHRGRFSLDDLEVLHGRKPRQAILGGTTPSPRLSPEARLQMLKSLVQRGATFAEYPDALFDTMSCPPFSPPKVGLFAYALGEYWPDRKFPIGVWIVRSGGWEIADGGEPRWCEQTERDSWIRPAVFELPAEMAQATWMYRAYEAEWHDEWRRRRPTDQQVTNI